MKTLKTIAILTAIATTFLAASCTKDAATKPGDNNGGKPPVTAAMQITRIDQDANNYTVFSYNADGKVAGYKNDYNGTITEINATYDANKRMATAVINNELYKFSYTTAQGTQVDRVDVYLDKNNTANVSFYTKYVYANNHITETELYGNLTGTFSPLSKTDYEYNTAGDIITRKIYSLNPVGGNMALSSTVKFEYDDKKNPLESVYDFTSVILGSQPVHNVTKSTVYDANNQVTETTPYTLTYNSNGYPTQAQQKTVKPGQPDAVATNKFTYK